MTKFFTALLVLVSALALDGTSAQAQINININRPAPQYVVVHEVHSEKKWKAPKRKKAAVLLVPAQPVYVVRRGHGHGHGKGKH